jgi:hypothetical protein
MKGLLAATLAVCLLLAAGGATAHAAAGPEVISCTKLKQQVNKKTGKAKKQAQAAYKRCTDQNKANKKAFALIKGTKWVGARASGQQEEWTFCATGAYTTKSTSGGSTGTSTGTSYKVAEATFKGNDFTAYVVDKSEGLEIAVARTKGVFQVGTARSFGEVEDLGPATRSAAGC